METLGDKNLLKTCQKFYCEYCDYGTSKKSSYDEHCLTRKHASQCGGDKKVTRKSAFLLSSFKMSVCEKCNKKYQSRNGLWKHKKKCLDITEEYCDDNSANKNETDNNLIMMLVKQNNELLEVIKNGTHNTNSHNVNSHNKTFNLQFFLNETCKDAMNITDFVDSIKVSLMDLEKVGEIGYVEGISNIISNNLKALDVTQRPIHCTDNKREVLYIKDENKWEKEVDEKTNVRKVIKSVVNKNIKMIPTFQETYPECVQSDSVYSEKYNKIIIESLGGLGENDSIKENKIIKKIAKDVLIDK